MNNTTGAMIRELRIKAGFTQKSLAAALHITDKAISKWERDICLPDVSLLPKLVLLLDIDVETLFSRSIEQEQWIGLLDITDCDFSQIVYDKPLVYYLLSHFLLLGINQIYVLSSNSNQTYLNQEIFKTLGFRFLFEKPSEQKTMIIDHPWFIFGSDLTQQFHASLISGRNIRLTPENQQTVMLFAQNGKDYCENKTEFYLTSYNKSLGRGIICLDLADHDKLLDAGIFVRSYQNNAGLLIGSLEEIAYRRGIISTEQLMNISKNISYGARLREIATKPKVG